ncbi:MAG: PfkB family carbohydrate kinase, partial [Bacteroidota bacterium]|nr:PfkB family carbohydrate kinase [Bacteroidota bacterium]
LFNDFESIKVGVIGDVMLDTYLWGGVERISPEAPVPIVSVTKKEQRIGGAGNVALNLRSLGAQPYVISVMGEDDEATCLTQLFADKKINSEYCLNSSHRITTNKTRIISRNQQMMRLDAELTNDLEEADQENLLRNFRAFVETESPDIVILEDYNKGVLTEAVIREVILICKEANVLTAVDPKRKNFFNYKGVDIFKPNLKEVKEALNILFADVELPFLRDIHEALQQELHHHISFITLSEKGVFYQQDASASIIPSHIRNIADVSGAGDTVIAVAAVVYAARRNVHLMAEIANIAGGLVCEEVGTAAINKIALIHECELLLS